MINYIPFLLFNQYATGNIIINRKLSAYKKEIFFDISQSIGSSLKFECQFVSSRNIYTLFTNFILYKI